ncbi:MSP domain protein [Ostertagia ostertagi]
MADTPEQKSEKITPDKALSVDPDCAYFNVTGGKSDHMLVNLGESRLAVKIRCSNNALYRVSPSAMFIEAGQCQNLVVIRQAGPARSDKLILQFLPCEKDVEDCKEFFKQADKNGAKPETLRITLKMVGDQGYRVIPSREVTDDAIS